MLQGVFVGDVIEGRKLDFYLHCLEGEKREFLEGVGRGFQK